MIFIVMSQIFRLAIELKSSAFGSGVVTDIDGMAVEIGFDNLI